jgi:aminopeptidase N
MLMGKENFRNGLRAYLGRYAGGNASWPDLIEMLDPFSDVDLRAWNKAWVDEPGRPQFTFSLLRSGQNVEQLKINQAGEDGKARTWPQLFDLLFVYPGQEEQYTVKMNAQEAMVNEVAGKPLPSYILFNATGYGYGVFPIDSNMITHVGGLKKPVHRASAYINLYENMLNGRYNSPLRLLGLYRSLLSGEREELNVKLLTGYINEIFWKFISSGERTRLAPQLEPELWQSLLQQKNANIKKLLFKCFQGISLTKNAQDKLYMTWKDQLPPAGVRLSEDDYTSLALSLAVRDYPSEDILQRQLARISNPDRRKRMVFLMPAINSSVTVRDRFFYSLRDQKNREKESWVIAALQYLHHPLRVSTSAKYLEASLDLLGEIQSTGDIFFPQSWLQASFGGHQSPEAAKIVRKFLETHPQYDPKLRSKILQAADGLFRAEKLLDLNR